MASANFIISESMIRAMTRYLREYMVEVELDAIETVHHLQPQLESLFLDMFDERVKDSVNVDRCPLEQTIVHQIRLRELDWDTLKEMVEKAVDERWDRKK